MHGTIGGYTNHGCRCEKCREANRLWMTHYRQTHKGTLASGDPRHGTAGGYQNYGCRCDACRAWRTALG